MTTMLSVTESQNLKPPMNFLECNEDARRGGHSKPGGKSVKARDGDGARFRP